MNKLQPRICSTILLIFSLVKKPTATPMNRKTHVRMAIKRAHNLLNTLISKLIRVVEDGLSNFKPYQLLALLEVGIYCVVALSLGIFKKLDVFSY